MIKPILRNILIVAALAGLCSSSFPQAPTTPFAVGVRQYTWMRGSRQVSAYIYYPATGAAGGNPITNAPIAPGVFPICEVTHGSGGSPQAMLTVIKPLAAAGFIVPAPVFTNASISEAYSGDLSKDVSLILTNTLALNGAGTPFTGRINAAVGVGVSGYSMGGMTTDGLLTAWPDSRIKAAVAISCVRMGAPSSSVAANVLFIHGDQDPVCAYSSARQAYSEEPPTKAFLTYIGGTHTSFWSNSIWPKQTVDWMRWSLYSDTAARGRLASNAASSSTRWEIVERSGTSGGIQAESATLGGGAFVEATNAGYNGSGYVNFPTTGGTATFNNISGGSGGSHQLNIRYSNGSGAPRTGTLIVNGANSSVTFPATANWTTWSTLTLMISLNSGAANAISIQSNGQDLANVDEITVKAVSTPDTYQAESATLGGGAFIESTNPGYTGSGYVNFPASGGTLTFGNVDGNGGGTKGLAIRYANGAPTARSGTITVNGVSANVTFNPTGAWTTWGTLTVNVGFNNSAANTVQLASTGQDLSNIDQITVP